LQRKELIKSIERNDLKVSGLQHFQS